MKPARDNRWLAVAFAVLAGCGPGPDAADEAEPTLDFTSIEQGLVTCSTRQDTGYRSGSAFTITVVTADGKPVELETANAYAVMQEAAARDGVSLVVVSGFRTMAEQQYLYSCYVNCSCNSCNLAAQPGYSNHQSGHALDLNTSAPGVYNWLAANAGRFGFSRTVPSEAWHWEWWGGGPGGGPCGNTPDNCTRAEADGCGNFGCGCVNHACSGGNNCDGSGSTARNVLDCGAFGCHSVDGTCSGGFCPGSGCTGKQTANCAAVGCGCVDEQCSGGFCPGTGCTARQALDCQGLDAGCSLGRCVSTTGEVVGEVDAGRPMPAPNDGGYALTPMDAGIAPPPTLDEPDPSAPAPVTSLVPAEPVVGGCSSVPGLPLVWVLAVVALARRRRWRARRRRVPRRPAAASATAPTTGCRRPGTGWPRPRPR